MDTDAPYFEAAVRLAGYTWLGNIRSSNHHAIRDRFQQFFDSFFHGATHRIVDTGMDCHICSFPIGVSFTDSEALELFTALPFNQQEAYDTYHFRLPCGHAFGNNCLRRWLANATTCPICRRELFPMPAPPLSAIQTLIRLAHNHVSSSLISMRKFTQLPLELHVPMPHPAYAIVEAFVCFDEVSLHYQNFSCSIAPDERFRFIRSAAATHLDYMDGKSSIPAWDLLRPWNHLVDRDQFTRTAETLIVSILKEQHMNGMTVGRPFFALSNSSSLASVAITRRQEMLLMAFAHYFSKRMVYHYRVGAEITINVASMPGDYDFNLALYNLAEDFALQEHDSSP